MRIVADNVESLEAANAILEEYKQHPNAKKGKATYYLLHKVVEVTKD